MRTAYSNTSTLEYPGISPLLFLSCFCFCVIFGGGCSGTDTNACNDAHVWMHRRCCGGLPERAVQWLASGSNKGMASTAQYPYTSAGGTDPTQGHCNKKVPLVAKLTGFGTVKSDAESMLASSTQYGVLSTAMDSTPLQFYKSGTYPYVPLRTRTRHHWVLSLSLSRGVPT